MNKTQRQTLILVLVIALLAFSTTLVAAKELNSLTISGPGIKGEITLDDPEGMMNLEQSGFFFQPKNIKPPENLGTGYNITAFLNLDGKIVPFVQMVYYPGGEGQPGYVHYTGRLNGESIEAVDAVDEWSLLPSEADIAFRDLMTDHAITLQPAVLPAQAEVAPAAAPAIESSKADSQPVSEPANIQAPSASEPQAVSEPASVPPVSSNPLARNPLPGLVLAGAILVVLATGLALGRRALLARRSA